MARRRGFHLSPPHKVTLLIAVILWLFGVAYYLPMTAPVIAKALAAVPASAALGGKAGVWALALAGLVLILGVTFEGM